MVSGVERRVVVRFFATRVIEKEDGDRTQRKGFSCQSRAWEWIARGALFSARNARCMETNVHNCNCKLCDPEKWRPVVLRLARILRRRANEHSEVRK